MAKEIYQEIAELWARISREEIDLHKGLKQLRKYKKEELVSTLNYLSGFFSSHLKKHKYYLA